MLSQKELKELLEYSPETGEFTWLISPKYKRLKDKPAGCLGSTGHWKITISRVRYYASHLAVLYMTGNLPDGFVDHINRIKSDNRWSNLREASSSQNNCNSPLRSDNSSGVKGLSWDESRNKWKVRLNFQGRKVFQGRFDDRELAELVVTELRNLYHKEWACHG